jgi:D-inositol-3-phosphate glycosyltransferase
MEPQRRLVLSLGAVDHASRFGWDATARGILDVYDQVLSRGAAAKLSVV